MNKLKYLGDIAGSIITKRQADISPCLFILTQSLKHGVLGSSPKKGFSLHISRGSAKVIVSWCVCDSYTKYWKIHFVPRCVGSMVGLKPWIRSGVLNPQAEAWGYWKTSVTIEFGLVAIDHNLMKLWMIRTVQKESSDVSVYGDLILNF